MIDLPKRVSFGVYQYTEDDGEIRYQASLDRKNKKAQKRGFKTPEEAQIIADIMQILYPLTSGRGIGKKRRDLPTGVYHDKRGFITVSYKQDGKRKMKAGFATIEEALFFREQNNESQSWSTRPVEKDRDEVDFDVSNIEIGTITPLIPQSEKLDETTVWECRCRCGNTFTIPLWTLIDWNKTQAGVCDCWKHVKLGRGLYQRGVVKDGNKWRAQYPGYAKWFTTKEEATQQRNEWVTKYGNPVWGQPPEDLSGKVFGNLRAISYAGSRVVDGKRKGAVWLCENILTGVKSVRRATDLKSGAVNGIPKEENLKKAHKAIEDSKINGVPMARYTDTVSSNNTTGCRGVSPYRGKYRARLTVKGKVYNEIGFDTPEEAHQARLEMERKYLPKHKKPPTA